MRANRAFLALPVLLLLFLPHPAFAQGCGIDVSAQPPVVNFPATSLPNVGGLTFYEVFNVNYSSVYRNQTLIVQFLNGSSWQGIQNFTGNMVGFTEVSQGLYAEWAKFGANPLRVISGSCVSKVATFAIQGDSGAVGIDVAMYAAVVLLVALFLVLGKRLGWKRFVFLAAAAYLALSPFTGQRYDIYFLVSSGIRVLQHVNPFDPGTPPIYPGPLKWAYPPLYAFYSALSFALYQLVTGAPLPSVSALTYPGWFTSTYSVFQAFVPTTLPVLVSILKLPMVVSALLTGLLLGKMTGSESNAIWWVANPLVILVAAIWGQLDPIATVLALASVYAFEKGKTYHAYLFASFGAAVKVWPALLIPLLFVVTLRRDGKRAFKPLLATLPALAVTVGLYALYGSPVQSLFLLVYARGIPTFAGAFSVNGLTWQELLFVMKAPPIPLFLLVGIPLYGVLLARMYWKKDADVIKWLVVSLLIFYLTYNYVNPQYFYWIVPFLLLQRRKMAALAFTLLPLVYIVLSYNLFYFVSPGIMPNEFAFGASIVDQLKVNLFYQSSAFLVLLAGTVPTAAYLYLLYREVRARGAPVTAQTREERVGTQEILGSS